MRSIYLIIFFITATVLFFYFVNSFTLTLNFSVPSAEPAANAANQMNRMPAPVINTTGTNSFTPQNFKGPSGQPGAGFIGPNGPPPNY
ncbi:MAG TPA: hypothetical protein VMV71_03710 [Candidatus Paceibacterota bacterium]|nr:hypothetical protein [Candidatus Paceibacterota bacterium]